MAEPEPGEVEAEAEYRVLVLAPSGRDGELAVRVLSEAGIGAVACGDTIGLRNEIERGAGALLLTEETLTPKAIGELAEILGGQLPWSDLPLLVMSVGAGRSETIAAAIRQLAERADITLLDRPTRKVTLISAVQAALRARRRQYEVRDLVYELERGVRERDRFLAMLSHELRNPLAAILTAIELMEQKELTVLGRERAVVNRQARVLSRLVDDLLDLSRLTLGKIAIAGAPVDLTEVVERSVEAHRPAAEGLGIELALELRGRRLTVRGDAVRLEQVMNNLLANALKYTPRGGSVAVQLSSNEGSGEIRVIDTGVGIDAKVLPRVFDPFTQADETIDRSQGGLGIGLTLVRHIVELHGGTVSAESDGRNTGSTFVVYLPAVRETAAAAPTPASAAFRPRAPRRILVIEDNADLRDGLKRLLEQVGHEVFASPDGEDGVVKALARHPDVVLVDIGLPKLDGYKVAARLKPELSDSLLVAVSGYGSQQDRRRAFDAGFHYHLTKPITLRALLDVLDHVPGHSGATLRRTQPQ
ncbi:MAG TPA: hybrid sensor histidine kinase/response regulator [Thermoanaerobaculia bacterium]